MTQLHPLHDRVILKRVEEERLSAGGIVIPDQAAEKPTQGEVLAIGPGRRFDDGQVHPLTVQVGDRVLFSKYAGQEVRLDGADCCVVKEDDILAVLKR